MNTQFLFTEQNGYYMGSYKTANLNKNLSNSQYYVNKIY